MALAGWLALCGTLVHAGVISLSTSQVGGVVTLTVTDSAPGDMCIGGFCAADFTIGFDPAVLGFIAGSEASDFMVAANSFASGEVQVSLLADPDAFPASHVLFSIDFNALMTQQLLLAIAPIDFGVPDVYLPDSAGILVNVVGPAAPAADIPGPNTALLAMLALAGMAWRRRTNLAHDRRPLRHQSRPGGARGAGRRGGRIGAVRIRR